MKRTTLASIAGVLALSLGACSDMTHQERGTLAGAAIGGVAGNVVTGGSTAGTLGGAAVCIAFGIQAQSAHINIISGATFTSEGFAMSLNAALNSAKN